MKREPVHLAYIVQAVADAAGLTRALILIDETAPYVYRCRWMVFLLARELTSYTNEEIGRKLDRTAVAVSEGVRKLKKLFPHEPQLLAIKARAEATLHARDRQVP